MPQHQTIQLQVSGLSCASCVGRAQRALQSAPGVVTATVNLATETATVDFDTTIGSPIQIADVVTKAGYPARPKTPDAAPQDKSEDIARLRRMTVIAALLALPVFLLEMGSHLVPGIHQLIAQTIGTQNSHILQFLLTTAVLFGPGFQFFAKGLPALLRRVPDMNSLVAIGTLAAYGFSVVATFAPGLLPAGTANVYFEAAAVIVVLILLGRYLEARAKGRTGDAIRRLIKLRSGVARVERTDQTVDLPIEEIAVGDIIQVRPGERVAVDGVVLSGTSFVNESMITGEPIPVPKAVDDTVIGGTINSTGAFRFRAARVGADTMLARIIAMVEQAQAAKLPIQGVVDRITTWFVPAVMVVAVATILLWLAFGPAPALPYALVAGVSVLIIACPCAMGLATPTSIMVGTGRAAELGVFFRKGDALQLLQEVNVVALDKTGTLTQGRPAMTDLVTAEGFDKHRVLGLIATVEALSEHPIANAVSRAAAEAGLSLGEATEFESITGLGAQARVDGHRVLIGSDQFMARHGIELGDLADTGATLAQRGRTPLYAAIDDRAAAVIGVSDPIKPTTPVAIKAFHDMGLKVAMISGDNQTTAQAIADELRIDTVIAGVLPDGKVAALTELRAGGKLAFVGDGINDAPALASADVGIAVGSGTDVAIEAADVVLISGDLTGVAHAFDISSKTMRNIHQNLFWAFGYNVLLIPVAAGVFYPMFGLMLSPVLAAGAMAMSSVFVVTNALRLRHAKPASFAPAADKQVQSGMVEAASI
ncbi:heavy metal translocating P-type ATPase [Sedimentitalea todarodis]|uniref:Heavy metal translocating P-type ATPase n=1 Tax=Sedimentitalea todarodis TaxID=1631240 RepID=A0ABU3VA17_9RHOB|nr:heavy metal translocating P-type ATPase [Sedimentitalea todarodis]MDU9003018.1 heavy metal translocating P-type ATPase [Sedimentitalea todarodis]